MWSRLGTGVSLPGVASWSCLFASWVMLGDWPESFKSLAFSSGKWGSWQYLLCRRMVRTKWGNPYKFRSMVPDGWFLPTNSSDCCCCRWDFPLISCWDHKRLAKGLIRYQKRAWSKNSFVGFSELLAILPALVWWSLSVGQIDSMLPSDNRPSIILACVKLRPEHQMISLF